VGPLLERAPGADSRRISEAWFWLISAFMILVLLVLSMGPGMTVYDEGLVLYGALKVFHGELPYRDFWSFYGPGQYYFCLLYTSRCV